MDPPTTVAETTGPRAASVRRVAISQSNYLPWKGYFDQIHAVDEFVLYDDVQYTTRDWRNRNRIKTPSGLRWLTVPVEVKGRRYQRIDEAVISDPRWAEEHWSAIRHAYARAPYFRSHAPVLEEYYSSTTPTSLSLLNRDLLTIVNGLLGINTKVTWSSDYHAEGDRTARLVSICRQIGAAVYLTGPAARAYLDESLFAAADLRVEYADYSGYPEYPQLHGEFEHHVSIIDLLFNTGPDAPQFMKSFPGDG